MKNLAWMLVWVSSAGWMCPLARAQWEIPADPAARNAYVAKLSETAQKADAPLSDRFAACRELAVVGDPACVPALAGLLTDEKMSHMARYGLEPNPAPAAGEALRAALGKVQGKLLLGVIDSIGIRRDAQAVSALSPFLSSADVALVSATAASLGRIGTAEAAAALEKALGAASGPALAAVSEGCIRAGDALCAAGKCDAAAALFERVRSSPAPAPARLAAARGAITARGKAGIPQIMEFLRGNDEGLAAVALRLCYEVAAPELTQALAAGLPGLPEARQIPVLRALGTRKDASAMPAVLSAARAGSAPVRLAAVQAACQIGCPSCLTALIEFCTSTEPEMSAAAQAGLAGFPGPEADAAVLKLLDSPDAKARGIAIDLAGQRRMSAALPGLLEAAGATDKSVSSASLKVLAELGSVSQIPALLNLLVKAPSAGVENALTAVCARESESAGGTPSQACVDALCAAMGSAPAPARQALLRVLRSAGGPKALATVRAAAAGPDAGIQDTATRVLCDWPSAEAAADQLALAKSSPNPTYRVLALRGYIRTLSDAKLTGPQRQSMCQEATALIQRDDERKLLLGALGNAGDASSLPLVLPLVDNPATREEACAAAVGIAERLTGNDSAAGVAAMKSVLKATQNQNLLRRARRVIAAAAPKPAAK